MLLRDLTAEDGKHTEIAILILSAGYAANVGNHQGISVLTTTYGLG